MSETNNTREPHFTKENPKDQIKEILSIVEKDVLQLSEGNFINVQRVFQRVKNNLRDIRALTEAYMSTRTKW